MDGISAEANLAIMATCYRFKLFGERGIKKDAGKIFVTVNKKLVFILNNNAVEVEIVDPEIIKTVSPLAKNAVIYNPVEDSFKLGGF